MSENKEGKRLKFLHCSDIHLDTPYVGMTPEKSDERRRTLRSTFMRMMEFVRERGVDYVLISGDLFDTQYATNTTAEILIREFKSCPTTKFIIAPGRCDRYDENPIYLSGRLPDNCYVFERDTLSRFYFGEDRVTVYGWAFVGERIDESPLYDNRVDDGSQINIVCGYADLDGDISAGLCPISSADLKGFGADYYALGSRHAKTEFIKSGGSMYSYSGSLECTGFDEPDLGGVKLLNIDYNDGELAIDGKHISFGRLQFVTETIDITGVEVNNEITNRISRMISSKRYGSDTALRVELVGSVDPRFVMPRHLESDAFGLYYFSVIDKTLPLFNTEHFKRDMSVAGEIYRRLLPILTGEDEQERLIAARAFRVALAALEGREIDL
ncbi:MAG: metallophosphoesterase [Clostridia bacterium]|nr:metallophosphoesterase [Clostridia bacterium]